MNIKTGRLSTSDVRVFLAITSEVIGEVFPLCVQKGIPDITRELLRNTKHVELIDVDCNSDSIFLTVRIENILSVAQVAQIIKTHLAKRIRSQYPAEIEASIGKGKIFARGYIALTASKNSRAEAEKKLDSFRNPSEAAKALSVLISSNRKKSKLL